MAAAVLKGLYRRATCGEGYLARLSLARVAACLMQYPTPESPLSFREPQRGVPAGAGVVSFRPG